MVILSTDRGSVVIRFCGFFVGYFYGSAEGLFTVWFGSVEDRFYERKNWREQFWAFFLRIVLSMRCNFSTARGLVLLRLWIFGIILRFDEMEALRTKSSVRR